MRIWFYMLIIVFFTYFGTKITKSPFGAVTEGTLFVNFYVFLLFSSKG